MDFLDSGESYILKELLREDFLVNLSISTDIQDEVARDILNKIYQKIGIVKVGKKRQTVTLIKRFSIAASILLFIFSAYFLFYNKQSLPQGFVKSPNTNQLINDFTPGVDKAVLTLGDGSVVIINDAANGNIAMQGSVYVEKFNDGSLNYEGGEQQKELIYNSVSTPRGGKFQLVLSDGTKVWLNASTTLKYPVVFNGAERKVELHGEAYFEVAENKIIPFKVEVAGRGEIEVMGTHFNVNAYAEESTLNTTLLEGSVKVKVGSVLEPLVLLPGQQAKIFPNGELKRIRDVNLEEVVAWKNGKFYFGESTDMETVMRQIGRWYDIEVEYAGNLSDKHLGGTISRQVNASKVFEMLEMTGIVKFKIVGKKVLVTAQNN